MTRLRSLIQTLMALGTNAYFPWGSVFIRVPSREVVHAEEIFWLIILFTVIHPGNQHR